MVGGKGLLNEMIAHSVEHFAWNTAQQKGDVANNGAKGAKTAFYCAFHEALREMFHGEQSS